VQARKPELDIAEIERRIQQNTDLAVAIEEDSGLLRLIGLVESDESKRAAEDIARAAAPDREIVNDIEVETLWPAETAEVTAEELGIDGQTDVDILSDELEPDFEDQTLSSDQLSASGPSGSADDLVSDGDTPYFPPTDPVIRVRENSDPEVVGGFTPTSDTTMEVDRSADGTIGDEALADAVRRELREDASTADLEIDVAVRKGVAILRGRVTDLDDAENAEAVAGSVPGIRDVVEDLRVIEL